VTRIRALAVLGWPAVSKCRIPALALAALTAVVTLTGCGARSAVSNRIRGRKLTIYASVPLNGASSVSGRAVLDGAELALDSIHARIGRYRIVFRELDDSTVQAGGWDPGQTTANVHLAMLDPTTIGYLGEYNSGASAVSIPLLNRDDIPQISASSTAVGLTDGGPEASPGEPAKYYPTGRRTFARVVPSDAVQATALADLQRSRGCARTDVLDDGEVDGRDIAASFEVAAKAAGLNVVGSQEYERKAASYASLAAGIAQTGADCVLIAAITEAHAVLVTRQIAAALPDARIFGSAGLAESTYVDPALGGIPLSLDPRVLITVATLGPAAYPPAARSFYSLYRHRYGAPQPYAIFGYEAMSLMLDAISRATHAGRSAAVRSRVLDAIFATRNRHSVVGVYSIDDDGDTSLARYGVYRVRDGRLSFWKAISG
jgi:branched-chain amino acid transport system substrate-binding protein